VPGGSSLVHVARPCFAYEPARPRPPAIHPFADEHLFIIDQSLPRWLPVRRRPHTDIIIIIIIANQ